MIRVLSAHFDKSKHQISKAKAKATTTKIKSKLYFNQIIVMVVDNCTVYTNTLTHKMTMNGVRGKRWLDLFPVIHDKFLKTLSLMRIQSNTIQMIQDIGHFGNFFEMIE